MNKKYMDFVPTRPAKKAPITHKKPIKPVTRPANPAHKPIKTSTTRVASSVVELGIIEDISLEGANPSSGRAPRSTPESDLKLVKAQKITTATSAEKIEDSPSKDDKSTYKTPKTPFINQDKVEKRPLSKNVYRKAPVVTKEEGKAPVTIITKPEKDTKIGLIITIILTIILGAAAGTVAFLLLPK